MSYQDTDIPAWTVDVLTNASVGMDFLDAYQREAFRWRVDRVLSCRPGLDLHSRRKIADAYIKQAVLEALAEEGVVM